MIPLITENVVNKGWASQTEIIDYIAVAQSTPGPFAINVSTFIGMKHFGVIGAAVTSLGVALPSFIIILLIAKFFMKFMEYKGVTAALTGIRPAVIGLMTSAVISIAATAFNFKIYYGTSDFIENIKSIHFFEVFIFLIVFILSRIKKLKINSYKIILISAVLGIAFYTVRDFIIF